MHQIGPVEQSAIEKVSAEFLAEGIVESQRKGWEGVRSIAAAMRPGMTELEATAKAQEILTDLGSPRAWHRPLIRFAGNTTKYFSDKSEPATLGENDIFFVDIGPNWTLQRYGGVEYESDVGDTFTVGENRVMKEVSLAVKDLFAWGKNYWRENRPTGPVLYEKIEEETKKRGYVLMSKSDGHRLSEFPHNQYSRKGFTEIDFSPSPYIWVLEVQIAVPGLAFGGFYEDILY